MGLGHGLALLSIRDQLDQALILMVSGASSSQLCLVYSWLVGGRKEEVMMNRWEELKEVQKHIYSACNVLLMRLILIMSLQ